MSFGSRPVMTLGSSGTSPTWRWTSRAVPSTRSQVADRRVPCLGVLRAGDVTPAGVAAEGLAEGGLGGQRGDGEDFVAGFQGAAAAAWEDSLASDDGHHRGVLGEQAHDEVVLVVAGGGDDGVDSLEAGSVEHGRLAGIAGDHDAPTARPRLPGGSRVLLDHDHLVSLLDQMVGDVCTPHARTGDQDTGHRRVSSASRASSLPRASPWMARRTTSPSARAVVAWGTRAPPRRVMLTTRRPPPSSRSPTDRSTRCWGSSSLTRATSPRPKVASSFRGVCSR